MRNTLGSSSRPQPLLPPLGSSSRPQPLLPHLGLEVLDPIRDLRQPGLQSLDLLLPPCRGQELGLEMPELGLGLFHRVLPSPR